MFAGREIAVSLTFFVLLYSLLSAVVAVAWHPLNRLRATERTRSALLFVLRILPISASLVIMFGLVVPSFQLLEPRSINEGLGRLPLALGICALLLIICGLVRVITAQNMASRVVTRWLKDARPLDDSADTVTFRSRQGDPPLALVGVRNPKVLVSESTLELLNDDELHIAVKHELAHMHARDNLKKLVLRFCPFPGMARLESAWSQSAELAADDAAVSRVEDAINLAAALIKLSRLMQIEVAPVCAVGFVTGVISVRVARLLAWDGTSKVPRAALRVRHAIPLALAAFVCFLAYSPALMVTHEITEWLVR